MPQASLPKCLIIDLEVVPTKGAQSDLIFKLGALRPDLGVELELSTARNLTQALEKLDRLVACASFVLGHNVIAHDLPLLRTAAPWMRLHTLPVIDTLHLSPLAFPQNPYHRLIKDYKLVGDSLNSPLSDCRSTLSLLQDQRLAFSRLNASHRNELLSYQALLGQVGSDLHSFFLTLTTKPPLSLEALASLIPSLLCETDPTQQRDLKVCRSQLSQLLSQRLPDPKQHWPLAFALAWLRVSGGNSVLAPWVRHQFPDTGKIIAELRDVPCGQAQCQYCRTAHDPHNELKRYFGFPDFRQEPDGRNLQHDVVLAGMRGKNVLAILATGGGKSLCYQLPALNRFHRNGSLSIIISPLQSLMKYQVDGLLARNIQCMASLNGLLTLPERVDVLEKIQFGDIGILLVSPEVFRNKAFRRAIEQRQVGAWIFDEAHCLSKWGNDFRTDYLYVARCIREYAAAQPLAPIAPVSCFTATAKPDVLADIREHFNDVLGIHFQEFIGTPERSNLSFEVLPCAQAEKWARIHQLVTDTLLNQEGGALVFVSRRKRTEELAEFLSSQSCSCQYFHAGLKPHEKKDIQDKFKHGELRVIVATNAFGMGVDKADIRLVVHADIPGSLENYLQEAGRAGRDQQEARCILLYDPQDVESQFGINERSKLSWHDLQQILRKLRLESSRRKGGSLVITAGEILLDDNVDTGFSMEERGAETKVVTAVAWLERGDYLKHEESCIQIFPARLKASAEEAEKELQLANLPARKLEEFRAILRYLYAADGDERINTDQLMALTGQTQEEVAAALRQLEQMALLVNDSPLTLFLRHGVVGSANQRLQSTLQLEKALFSKLRELAPDADQGAWQDVALPSLTASLKVLIQQDELLPLQVLRLLRSLAQDRDGESQQCSSFELRQLNRDHLKLRIKEGRSWGALETLGEKRRDLAGKLMAFLLGKLAPGIHGKDLLVETTFGELTALISNDLELSACIVPEQRNKVVEHVLLYLHQQEVLTLNHGMTVVRRAMTIEVNANKRGKYLKQDYLSLDEHYREKCIQVHVMREYAEVALKEMASALALVLHYFADGKRDFIKRYFGGREEVLKLSTSEDSWRNIVQTLNAPQALVVTENTGRNRLVLAGPGSGKTRVIVHRIAYLLRVLRVPASSVIALTFNRHAANEIRRRLLALVGADAYGLTVLTYHSMVMRLTGTSFERGSTVSEAALKGVLEHGVALLEGKCQIEGEDDLRERLLRGYRYILVDEYQDIDELQYRLVRALSGRQDDGEGQLCILAVGDDDQNIYGWRDTSNRYIEQFRQDYAASTSYLVDNYRSSQYIIAASNQIIQGNPQRLKEQYPCKIDQVRQEQANGGVWNQRDPERQGRVLRLALPQSDLAHGNLQAQAAVAELQRLLALEEAGNWQACAILARCHRYLCPIQAWCEQNGVAYHLAADKDTLLPLTRQRVFCAVIEALRGNEASLNAESIAQSVSAVNLDDEWKSFFQTAITQFESEFGDCGLSAAAVIDWFYDYARELRQQQRSGLYLGSIHSAKGLEFRHVVVLDGGWRGKGKEIDDERRLYYVAMTRAEQTLTLCEFAGGNPFSNTLGDAVLRRRFLAEPDPRLEMHYRQLSLREIDLGFAGRQPEGAPVHAALRRLKSGDPITLKADGSHYLLLDGEGNVVGRTDKSFSLDELDLRACEVAAIQVRFATDGEEQYKSSLKCARWEVLVPRLKGLALAASPKK